MSPPSEADSVASLSAKLAVDASIDQQALRRLGNVYGGLNTMLACYLRDGFVLFDHSKARTRIMRSLQHRVDHQLDERAADLAEVIERHPVRRAFPSRYDPPVFTTDGCPVLYTKLAAADFATLSTYTDSDLKSFVALFYERSLQLSGQSTRENGVPCKGTVDIYDCTDVYWSKLISGFRTHKRVVSTLFDISEHCPDGLYKCFVINAPALASIAWKLVKPFVSERAQNKVTVSRGIPPELTTALGGEAKLRKMMDAPLPPETV